ncbi:unnamed protein product [Acidithrix sp. C25]|nr:unnamed protein product [Acidithrix sp. C25]
MIIEVQVEAKGLSITIIAILAMLKKVSYSSQIRYRPRLDL